LAGNHLIQQLPDQAKGVDLIIVFAGREAQ
jgi:hypothetical protein